MLDKQINLFSVNTNAFLSDKEIEIKSDLVAKKKDYAKKEKELIAKEKRIKKEKLKDDELKETLEDVKSLKEELGKLRGLIKELEPIVSEKLKNELLNAVEKNKRRKNKKIRKLDERYVRYCTEDGEIKDNLNNIVSMFESDLTRSFGIETNELTKKVIVVEIWFYDLAQDLILNGFDFDEKHYVYFSSSAGQIRTKKAVFVEEEVYEKCKNKLMCGLTLDKINEKGGMNVNKYLAYLALCNSATETWFNIFDKEFDIDRCIVVDDFETLVKGNADHIDYETYKITENKEDEFMIPQTDGCGLIDSEYCDTNFMVRLPFIKGLLGSFDYKRFIRESGASGNVKDIWGKEYNILEDDIQIIFTKSQLKMYNYYESWDEYKSNFKQYKCDACVCNIEEKYISNAKINYQMLQTLHDMTNEEVVNICDKSNEKTRRISKSLENMLEVFGVSATKEINPNNHFKLALQMYPELMKDISNKDNLRDLKKSLVNKYKAGKLEVMGKFTFVLPDLYAFCEWLFLEQEAPSGMLSNGEVFCKLYKNYDELDCLRSPSLYIEHAIRKNVCNKRCNGQKLSDWFTTNAIYISCDDLISRILQLDM